MNSPCNPTGAVYSRADWGALGAVLREHPRIVVLSDDIYEHIYWADDAVRELRRRVPRALRAHAHGQRRVEVLRDERLANRLRRRTVPLIKAMTSIQSQSTTNACTISQAAACAALDRRSDGVREMCAEFKQRHDAFLRAHARHPGLRLRARARRVLPVSERRGSDARERRGDRRRVLRAAARGDRRRARARLGVRRAGTLAHVVRGVARARSTMRLQRIDEFMRG